MSDSLIDQVVSALSELRDPLHGERLLDLARVGSVRVEGERLVVVLQLPFAAQGLQAQYQAQVADALSALAAGRTVDVQLEAAIAAGASVNAENRLSGVRNILAVASGKGGVGKSTTAVNLALALQVEGARVGLLDADIYGPSQQMMLGIADGQRPEQEGSQHLLPIRAHGLQTMSMGYLVNENTPMVWRGPMVSGALLQMLNQTRWDDLDYLVIDMPPGTGDIPLTLAQKVPVTAAVIVTTPQDIALLDAKKGVEMFRKVEVPVLGVVENMAVHICTQCGHEEHLFGHGGGARIAQDYGVPLLGSLPLALSIREQVDAGNPSVVAEPEGDAALRYRAIARQVSVQLAKRQAAAGSLMPSIEFVDD